MKALGGHLSNFNRSINGKGGGRLSSRTKQYFAGIPEIGSINGKGSAIHCQKSHHFSYFPNVAETVFELSFLPLKLLYKL